MKYKILALVLSLVLTPAVRVRADSPASPRSYKQVTKNEKYIFVMLARTARDYDPDKLKEKYPDSGLYMNDGSTIPLWRVEWYSFRVDVASDGRHLVRRGDWPQTGDKGETEAVSFYQDGIQLKRYRIKDLVPIPEAMPRTVSHYDWFRAWKFDDEKQRLIIETAEGKNCPSKKYVFDVTTGEIVKDEATQQNNAL